MKFVTYSASGTNARPGLLTEEGILPLPYELDVGPDSRR